MESVLFHQVPAVVDELIEERRRTGVDRFDEVWEGVYVVNPPPSYRHASIAGRIVDRFRPGADARGLDVRWEVGIGGPQDHRIPDVVVADPADVDEAGHYLRTAVIAVEVLSPNERTDKRPFYLDHGVDEVVIVDPGGGTVEWWISHEGGHYEAASASTVLPVTAADLADLLG